MTEIDKLVKRLRHNASLLSRSGILGHRPAMLEAADALESLAKQLAEVQEVIQPFADVADAEDEAGREDPDNDRIWVVQACGCLLANLTVEHFRAARRFLEGE